METNERLEKIDVIRKIGNQMHVLGRNGKFSKYLNHIVYDITYGEIIDEDFFIKKDKDDLIRSEALSLFGVGIPFLIYELMPKQRERRRKTKEYNKTLKDFKDANMKDLIEAVKDIRVYQGSIKDVERDSGNKLKRIDTEKPETFIRAKDTFWLRVKAYSLGADAVINYQPGSSMGTPVKYL